MVRDFRSTLGVSLVFASVAGLLACPQLLSDDFGPSVSPDDESCARRQTCVAGAAGSGGAAGGTSGAGGTTSGAGGSAPSAAGAAGSGGSGSGGSGSGGSGESGSAGSAGSGESGSAGSAGSGSSDPADAAVDSSPDCWLLKLDDTTHQASDNCLGINGWNQIETDPASASEVSLSYEDDGVCFTGTIDNIGWGAVYNLTFNDTNPWDADTRGVGGFQLDASGESLPPQIEVVYTDASAGDFCRVITPAEALAVPFASAHPGCSTSSSSVTDAVDLTHIRLVFPIAASDYAIDFCLVIRAIP